MASLLLSTSIETVRSVASTPNPNKARGKIPRRWAFQIHLNPPTQRNPDEKEARKEAHDTRQNRLNSLLQR